MTATPATTADFDRAERDALIAERRIGVYVGYDCVHHFFAAKADADRFLVLSQSLGCERPVLYGAECDPHVIPTVYAGVNCFAVILG